MSGEIGAELRMVDPKLCPLVVVVDAQGKVSMSSCLADPADVVALLDQIREVAATKRPRRLG